MKRIYGIIVFILLGDSIFGQTTKSKIEGTWALCATYQTEVPITLIVYDRNFNWEYFFKKDLNAVNKSWNMTDTSRFIYKDSEGKLALTTELLTFGESNALYTFFQFGNEFLFKENQCTDSTFTVQQPTFDIDPSMKCLYKISGDTLYISNSSGKLTTLPEFYTISFEKEYLLLKSSFQEIYYFRLLSKKPKFPFK